MAQSETELRINVNGRTIVAQPRPEDQGRLAQLLGDAESITIQQFDGDTEGHLLADEITVDVEGHAMTLRLPNAGDAAALRRILAVGTLTATIAIGGVFAASMSPAAEAPLTTPGAGQAVRVPVAEHARIQVADDVGMADSASQLAAEEFAASRAVIGTTGAVTAPAKPTTGSGQADFDVGLADGASQAAAEQFAAEHRPQQANPRQGGSRRE